MPIYSYECTGCGHLFDEFRKIAARLSVVCPKCKSGAKQILTPVHQNKLYPFTSEDFEYGKTIEVKSKKHYMQLCRQYGVYAIKEFGKGFNISEI